MIFIYAGTFFLILIIMVVTSVICTVLVIHIGYHTKKMPRWIKMIFIDFLAKAVCMDLENGKNTGKEASAWSSNGFVHTTDKERHYSTKNRENNDAISTGSKIAHDISSISSSLDFIKSEMISKADEDDNHAQWKHVSMVIDRCLLLIFGSFALVVTLVMTSYIVAKSNQDFAEVTELQ